MIVARGLFFQSRERGLGEVEERVDVRVEGVAPLRGGEVEDVGHGVLCRVVQHAAWRCVSGTRFWWMQLRKRTVCRACHCETRGTP